MLAVSSSQQSHVKTQHSIEEYHSSRYVVVVIVINLPIISYKNYVYASYAIILIFSTNFLRDHVIAL